MHATNQPPTDKHGRTMENSRWFPASGVENQKSVSPGSSSARSRPSNVFLSCKMISSKWILASWTTSIAVKMTEPTASQRVSMTQIKGNVFYGIVFIENKGAEEDPDMSETLDHGTIANGYPFDADDSLGTFDQCWVTISLSYFELSILTPACAILVNDGTMCLLESKKLANLKADSSYISSLHHYGLHGVSVVPLVKCSL